MWPVSKKELWLRESVQMVPPPLNTLPQGKSDFKTKMESACYVVR